MIAGPLRLLRRLAGLGEPDRRQPDRIALVIDGRAVPVRVQRRGSARRMTLRLSAATGEFAVTAPPAISAAQIRRFVEGQAGWAAARLARLPSRTVWEPGALIPLRGVPHRIVNRPDERFPTRIRSEAGEAPAIELAGKADTVPGRIARFLRAEAAADLKAAVARHAETVGRPVRRVAIRETRSRWGSCSASGTLSFSWRLILAPPFVLDYLAAHECAHLVEMNHSARFWALTRTLCPATDEAEAWLNRHGAALHRHG